MGLNDIFLYRIKASKPIIARCRINIIFLNQFRLRKARDRVNQVRRGLKKGNVIQYIYIGDYV